MTRDGERVRRESDGGRARRDPLLGRVIAGRFKVASLVARGGMGRIYRAEQHPLGRIVALKVLADPDGGEEFKQRFFREASVCARLAHPNTVRVFDYGQTEDDVYYIAMEFIDGSSLRQILDQERTLSAGRVIDLARQICGSLAEAHALGLVHRDLKPGNVLIARHGDDAEHVKVVDFGLVKHARDEAPDVTRSGYIVGSPLYMSPEQIRGDPVGPPSDLYSLGALMYTCLTGKPPFERENALAVLMSHLRQVPPPLDERTPGVRVPRVLSWVVMRCLEKDPADRFTSVNELARALRLAEAELRGLVRPDLPLRLVQGALELPHELDQSLTVRPGRLQTSLPPAEASAPSLARTLATHAMPLWGVAALGLVAILAATAMGIVGAILLASRWLDPEPVVLEPSAAQATPVISGAPPDPLGTVPVGTDPAGAPPALPAPPPAPEAASPDLVPRSSVDPPLSENEPPGAAAPTLLPAATRQDRVSSPSTKEDSWSRPSDIRDPWSDGSP